jgi:hypothetical protein
MPQGWRAAAVWDPGGGLLPSRFWRHMGSVATPPEGHASRTHALDWRGTFVWRLLFYDLGVQAWLGPHHGEAVTHAPFAHHTAHGFQRMISLNSSKSILPSPSLSAALIMPSTVSLTFLSASSDPSGKAFFFLINWYAKVGRRGGEGGGQG